MLCISLVMIVMANASLNVALPTLAESLHTGVERRCSGSSTRTRLVFAGLLLTAGSLGDRYGRRLALNGGLVVFGAASLFAVMSSSAGAVIGARAVMGVGAAFVMPATLSILAHVFPPERAAAGDRDLGRVRRGRRRDGRRRQRRAARALLVGIDLPHQRLRRGRRAGRGLLPHPAVAREDPRAARPARRAALDRRAERAGLRDHRGARPRLGLDADAGDVRARARGARRRSWPGSCGRRSRCSTCGYFRNPRFTAATTAITLVFFAMFGSYFLFTQYLQFVHGYSPLSAGVRILPWALAYLVSATQSAKLVERFGQRRVVASGSHHRRARHRAPGAHEQRDRELLVVRARASWCRRSAWASRPRRRRARSCGRCRCTRRASARR